MLVDYSVSTFHAWYGRKTLDKRRGVFYIARDRIGCIHSWWEGAEEVVLLSIVN